MYNNYNLRNDYYNYKNNNYNQPTYTENANPNNLYDPYQGFIRGNMFKNLYNTYKLNNPVNIMPANDKEQLLLMLDAICFAKADLSLYLTIYPEDKDMLELFNQYRIQENSLRDQYEKMYGSLTLNSEALNKYPWEFNNGPWPWENRR